MNRHPLDKVVAYSLQGGLPLLIFALALVLGLIALNFTPREEEPQIVVPMIDVLVESPGLSAEQTERQVTIPLEKLLAQIPGVEHVYSSTLPAQTAVTLRFHVGEDREDAILNTYNKLYSNQNTMPAVVASWIVQPIEVDDVPIIMLGLWSSDGDLYGDYELRRLADEVSTQLQAIDHTSQVNVVGGRPRNIEVFLQPESLAARQTSAQDILFALQQSNVLLDHGAIQLGNQSFRLQAGDVLRDVEAIENLVVNVIDGAPVLLKDIAKIEDGPAQANAYSWIDFAPHSHVAANQGDPADRPLVTISVAKQKGSNAVEVASQVHAKIAELKQHLFPPEIEISVLRDYGATANEKVNNLVQSLVFAVFTVVVFIAVFLGWRAAIVVGLAVPITYGITLALDMAFGYTINRVTLFALILSLGLLVDDPITGVDNIDRFLGRFKDKKKAIVGAISEVRTPLVMSTITVILAFIPLSFITGMMGPYIAPIAFNVPVSVTASTVVAFLVTPWLASKFVRAKSRQQDNEAFPDQAGESARSDNAYERALRGILSDRRKSKLVLWGVLGLFVIAAMLPLFRLVPLKLLPYDNKNEVQIVVDMKEGSTLESTAALAKQISNTLLPLNEVEAIAAYVGVPSPMDFNGMVRRYYQRLAPNMADLRVVLVDKAVREHQSHSVVLRMRELLEPLQTNGATIKVVEVPPGPPVLSTLVVELTADELTDPSALFAAAEEVEARLGREPHVVEVDSTLQAAHARLRFITDKQKAALSGVSTADISQTLQLATSGIVAGFVQEASESKPLPLVLRLDDERRSSIDDLLAITLKGRPGFTSRQSDYGLDEAPQTLVALGELGVFEQQAADQVRFRKDLQSLVYVMAEINGRTPAEVIADVYADYRETPEQESDRLTANYWDDRHYFSSGGGDLWSLPKGVDFSFSGEGEWRITKDVFRDMGLAFMFALVAIFFVLKMQTHSSALSLIIMSAIPLTIIGIMPGFWLINLFGERTVAGAPDPILFTATAMIGMIALAGIVVRNSLIMVEFITQKRAEGLAVLDALVSAGSVRLRPVLLTAGTTLLGNLVITLDPVFSGLALAIIFGIVASTAFTLLIVPIIYLLVFERPETQTS